MTNINNKNITFTFRSKFERLLSDENRPIITDAFKKFCNLEAATALNILWSLTYDANIASAALNELGLNLEIISPEEIPNLRNELRSQYKQLQPDFLKVDAPEECRDAFTALENHTDSIVANVVYEHCQARLYIDDYYMERIMFLLNSDKENNFFGGIRELLFNHEEAVYLKPFHTYMHDLLDALYKNKQQEESSYKNTPFERLAALVKDAGMDLPFDFEEVANEAFDESLDEVLNEVLPETPAEEPVQTSSEFKPLTLEEILPHKDVFTSFVKDSDLNVLVQIGKLGFDLNEVMAKKDKISNLLKAVEAKEKAEAKLLKATEAKEKAEVKLLKAAEALSK